MDLTRDLHLLAGLGAIVLGAAAHLRRPGRTRARLFALLCAAIALWNLGVAGNRTLPDLAPWRLAYRLGGTMAPPVGLHLCMVLTRTRRGLGRRLLIPSYAVGLLLFLLAVPDRPDLRVPWLWAALIGLGTVLALALRVLVRHLRRLAPGPERSAFRLFLFGAAFAAVGGLTDFIPRDGPWPRLGPIAVLLFLLVVCATVVRHRFLDVDRFFARGAALVLGAALATAGLVPIFRWSEGSYLPLFLAVIVVLALAGPVSRALRAGTRTLAGDTDPVARSLAVAARRLPDAATEDEVWHAVSTTLRGLPGVRALGLWLAEDGGDDFSLRHVSGDPPGLPPAWPRGELTAILDQERSPVTRRFLDEESWEARGPRRRRAAAALGELDRAGLSAVLPLSRADRLEGWIGLAGRGADAWLTSETAAALLALGNEALADRERVLAQEEARRRAALAAVGEMAAGLAHEIRNPLGAIHGAAQVLETESAGERAEQMRDILIEESDRLDRVVDEFLAYARPASSRREPIDLAQVARTSLRAAEASGARIRGLVTAEEDCPRAVGDPDQLRRVVDNLVRNAWEAAGDDARVELAVRRDGPGRVLLEVADDGPGIPAEEMPRLFHPFHTTKSGGTGLGLALVHRIVEDHGGEIHVDGRPGRGARFRITLPADGDAS